jgi:hypothetical protein
MCVMRRYEKPIVLFVDDGHDLHSQTLLSLRQLIEKMCRHWARLSIVLAGHPPLKNDLRCPTQEETWARTTMFEFGGIQDHQRRCITWLLEQCAPDGTVSDILAPDALELLAERLSPTLHIQHYLTLILEQTHRFGERPGTPTIVNATRAPDMHALEPTFTRYGYNVKALSELLHIRYAKVRLFPHGRWPPVRTEDLHRQLLAAGIPLGDRLSSVYRDLAMG